MSDKITDPLATIFKFPDQNLPEIDPRVALTEMVAQLTDIEQRFVNGSIPNASAAEMDSIREQVSQIHAVVAQLNGKV